jgi:short-subunit dehydrogenase
VRAADPYRDDHLGKGGADRMSIVIVGAGPNLGAAIARRFGREGMPVGVVSRNRDKLELLARVRRLAIMSVTIGVSIGDGVDADVAAISAARLPSIRR